MSELGQVMPTPAWEELDSQFKAFVLNELSDFGMGKMCSFACCL